MYMLNLQQAPIAWRKAQNLNLHCTPNDDASSTFIDALLFITAGSTFKLKSSDMSNSDNSASTYASMTDKA